MDIFDSYTYIPHGDGQNGIFRPWSYLLSPFLQPSSLRLHFAFSLFFFLLCCCRCRGLVLFSLPGPRPENVVVLIRPSINDYMQVLCYIAT